MFHPLPPYPGYSPVCPIYLLPEPLKSAVFHAVRRKGVPPAIALIDAVAATASVVHCGYDCVTPDGEFMPATINTCVVAPSASGKGRSVLLFFRHFLQAHKERKPRVVERDKHGKPIKTPRFPRVETMMNKLSYRALLNELDGKGMNLTIQCEESASFLKTDLFKNNTDALTQVWSGEPPLDHFVNGVELIAADARCSLGFRIQPELMYEFLKGSGRKTYKLGFWPRTIAGCHDPKRFPLNENCHTDSIPNASPEAFQHRITALSAEINDRNADGFAGRIPVELDVGAKAFMLELSHRMKDWLITYYDAIRESAGRAWENTLRVAVVLHVFCVGKGPVSREMVELAWAIVEWSLSQHRLIFAEALAPASNKALKVTNVRPIRARTPTPPKPPRPMQDAQWTLDCLDRLWNVHRRPTVLLSELQLLTGLSDKKFATVLAWLKVENAVDISGDSEEATIRRL